MIDSICINRTKDEFARYMWMLNAYSHRFRRVHVDNIVPNSLYRGGCRAHTHWFVDQRIEQGSPAYLGLACSRATSYVTHNSTNSITKFEVIQARQPASNSFHPQLLSLDYVSSTISCTVLTWKLCLLAFDGVARSWGMYQPRHSFLLEQIMKLSNEMIIEGYIEGRIFLFVLYSSLYR